MPKAAVVYQCGGPVEVVDLALSPLGRHDVRVAIAASGVPVAASTGASNDADSEEQHMQVGTCR